RDCRPLTAKDLKKLAGCVFQGGTDLERQARFLRKHLVQEFVGATDMHNLIRELDVEKLGKLLVALFASVVNAESYGVDAFGLKSPILHRQASGQISDLADDPILKVQNGIFTKLSASLLEYFFEGQSVPGLVGALAGEKHPQLPRGIREVGDGACRTFGRVHLLVHLPMHELLDTAGVPFRKVCAFFPGVDHLEPSVAS